MASCLKVMYHPEIYPGLVKSYHFNTWCFIGRIGTLWIWTVHSQYYCVNVNCRGFVPHPQEIPTEKLGTRCTMSITTHSLMGHKVVTH